MSNLAIYLFGSILVAGGLAYGAYLLGIPQAWIAIIAIIVIGFGIMGGVKKTRSKEESPTEE